MRRYSWYVSPMIVRHEGAFTRQELSREFTPCCIRDTRGSFLRPLPRGRTLTQRGTILIIFEESLGAKTIRHPRDFSNIIGKTLSFSNLCSRELPPVAPPGSYPHTMLEGASSGRSPVLASRSPLGRGLVLPEYCRTRFRVIDVLLCY